MSAITEHKNLQVINAVLHLATVYMYCTTPSVNDASLIYNGSAQNRCTPCDHKINYTEYTESNTLYCMCSLAYLASKHDSDYGTKSKAGADFFLSQTIGSCSLSVTVM